MLTYHSASEMVLKGRNGTKKLGCHTYLRRINDLTLAIRYHNTDIIFIYQNDSYQLFTGGYKSVTTKRRFNEYVPGSVFQKNNQWYYSDFRNSVSFVEGMTIDSTGVIC